MAATGTPLPVTLAKPIWTDAVDQGTNAPHGSVKSFSTDAATIYADIRVTNLVPGDTFSAKWTYNKTSLDAFNSIVVAQEALASGWVEFHVSRSQGGSWPEGTYEITVEGPNGVKVTGSIKVS